MNNNKTKSSIIRTLSTVERTGMKDLIEHLANSDFFIAPASTKYHSSHEGGLAEHSLNVYNILQHKNKVYKLGLPEDTVIICALLHDVCKIGFYKKTFKNVKKGTKINDYGREVANWVEEEVYEVDDLFPLGHGEKSVILLSRFIKLTEFEMLAIRWHMGFSEPQDLWNSLRSALDKHPEIICLHTSDLEASQLIEK